MENMTLQEFILLFLTFCSTHVLISADDLEEDSLEKRAPGWGKRESVAGDNIGYLQSVLSDLSKYELENNEDSELGLEKRRPGWGKRDYDGEYGLDKRRPGWGKRSLEQDLDSIEMKRAPGWGKRSYGIAGVLSDGTMVKRRPGWGKRSMYDEYGMDKRRPGWGKRAPGWGKRSDFSKCQRLLNEMRIARLKLYQVRNI